MKTNSRTRFNRKLTRYWDEFLYRFQESSGYCTVITIGPEHCYPDGPHLQRVILSAARRLHINNIYTKATQNKVYIIKETY